MAKKKRTNVPKQATKNLAAKAAEEIVTLATTEEGEELTKAEEKTLFKKCETTIRANVEGFVAVGVALTTIRRNKLYELDGFKSFEDYCETRWGFGKSRASQLIKAAATVYSCTQAKLPPPPNEAQARELGKLKPEQQVQVWGQIVAKSPLEKITAPKVAKAVAKKLKPKPKKQLKSKNGAPETKAADAGDGRCSFVLISYTQERIARIQQELTAILSDEKIVALPAEHRLRILLEKLEIAIIDVANWLALKSKSVGRAAQVDADEAAEPDADDAAEADADDAAEADEPAQDEAEEEATWTA
jgi:hypothetical protein